MTESCSVPKPKKTIAVYLKEAGYSTAGFHSNPFLSSAFGYGEGFDEFYEGERAGPLWPPYEATNTVQRSQGAA